MARLVYAMNQSLDGYVKHEQSGPPDPALFRHFIEDVRSLTGMLYGCRMYEVMRYWDDDLAEWGADEREYAAAWRRLSSQSKESDPSVETLTAAPRNSRRICLSLFARTLYP